MSHLRFLSVYVGGELMMGQTSSKLADDVETLKRVISALQELLVEQRDKTHKAEREASMWKQQYQVLSEAVRNDDYEHLAREARRD